MLYERGKMTILFLFFNILWYLTNSHGKNNNEFSNEEQLSYIFPNDSHRLHKYDIKSKEYEMIPHFSFNRYLWECHLDFI